MVMFVISMISRALHSFLKMAYADWINHLAGAAVGGLKGFLICAVMVTLLTYFINDADFIKKSRQPYRSKSNRRLQAVPPRAISEIRESSTKQINLSKRVSHLFERVFFFPSERTPSAQPPHQSKIFGG